MGVVQKIDESSRQLAEALDLAVAHRHHDAAEVPLRVAAAAEAGRAARRPGHGRAADARCALIVDEAHSSQGARRRGAQGRPRRRRAGGSSRRQAAGKRVTPAWRQLVSGSWPCAAGRRTCRFFAFTATPKYKTFVFGLRPPRGQPSPSTCYSMRQAIEEGFILDVLKYYITYSHLLQAAESLRGRPERRAQEGSARSWPASCGCTHTTSPRRRR